MIIGGDLNLSLGQVEVWGPNARSDLLKEYFTWKLVERNWLDIERINIKPTWKTNRCGDGRVSKRLDRFLVSENLMDRQQYIRQWVGSGGHSDHLRIFLEYKNGPEKPPSLMKFNKTWLKDESFW